MTKFLLKIQVPHGFSTKPKSDLFNRIIKKSLYSKIMKAEQREPKKYINSVAYLLVIILNNLKQRVYFTIISNNKVVV